MKSEKIFIMKHKILLIIIVWCLPLLLQAQTVKPVTVSADEPFVDHLTLQEGYKDTDLKVTFQFDEANNMLTMLLEAYRSIFVLQDDVRYKQIIRHSKLKPERFPYVVTTDKKQRFKLTTAFKKSVKKPRKKHVFRRWLAYEGLMPRQAELKLVNDTIVQKFDVMNHQNNVSITLRDIFLMGREAKNDNIWWLCCGKDCDTRYEITIQRDPCFGLETDLQSASKNLSDLQKGYKSLTAKFGSRKVSSQEALALFQKMQSTLLQQYPRQSAVTTCPTLQDTWNQYNTLLDSIAQMNCTLVLPQPVDEEDDTMNADHAVNPNNLDAMNIYSKARQIDELVSRWMLTDDETERRDIVRLCEQAIKDTNAMIRKRVTLNEEHRKAIKVFRAAERYYHTTTHN